VSRTDGGIFPEQIGDAMLTSLSGVIGQAAEVLEVAASHLDQVDGNFASTVRTRAAQYRAAAGIV
jgi:hypothetical protein